MLNKLLNRYCGCILKKNDKGNDKGSDKGSDNENNPICIIDYKETSVFIPPITCGQVIKVYDGDTITIASKLPYPESPLYRFQVRLAGIDCPEIKTKNEEERAIALLARKEMEDLTFQKTVYLTNLQNEKYGRILADVYVDNIHLNQHMIKKKLAVNYDGATKQSPKSWIKYYYTDDMNNETK